MKSDEKPFFCQNLCDFLRKNGTCCDWQVFLLYFWRVLKIFLNPRLSLIVPLKLDVPILTCISVTFNWLTLTSEMHFVKFHPEVASCLLPRGKRKYVPLGMRLLWKYIRNYFLVYHLIFTFFVISPKLQRIWSWNFGFANRKIWAFIWYQKIYYFWLSHGGWECDRRSFKLGITLEQ